MYAAIMLSSKCDNPWSGIRKSAKKHQHFLQFSIKQPEVQSGREEPPTGDFPAEKGFSNANLQPAESKFHPSRPGDEIASIFSVGTATIILLAAVDIPLAKKDC
jgi:hypothetical protein